KSLKDILYKVSLLEVVGDTSVSIESLAFDSRKVEEASCFFAQAGTQVDGHDFIASAIKDGAIAIVCERLPKDLKPEVTYIKVNNASEALGICADNFYDNP